MPIRILPQAEIRSLFRNGPIFVGTVRKSPSGISCSRPSDQTCTLRDRVGISRSPSPSSSHSSFAAGFWTMNESGPPSMSRSPCRSVRITPPSLSFSTTVTGHPAFCSSYAQDRPAMPPPMMIALRGFFMRVKLRLHGHARHS